MGARTEAKNGDLKEKHEQCHGMVAKAKFREDWAKGLYDKHVETHTMKYVHSIVHEEDWTFLPLARIVVEEGGGRTGMTVAINYCCQHMIECPAWYEYSEWTKTAKFLRKHPEAQRLVQAQLAEDL